ncbi:hypothetical protein [Acetobacter sp. DsW_059]|uniref:hypothetical protein n=1 Tax=Acetobacter sp. DsW_059 TaxID=1670661 RepID=UPI000A3D4DA5|nr:hypothetical protein [Acetobacter sp. DsW_059]OUJ10327.1 hypothetical protein HK25_07125 [Acetobacter sp. DsW_059]
MPKIKPLQEKAYDIYKEARRKEAKERLVIVMPVTEVMKIDAWGVPNGMESRTSAIRHLLDFALKTKKASDIALGKQSDASDSE